MPDDGIGRAGRVIYWAMVGKVSDALLTLTELNVLDQFVEAPTTTAAVADRLGLDRRAIALLTGLLADAGLMSRYGDALALPSDTAGLLPFLRLEARLRREHQEHGSLSRAIRGEPGYDPMDGADLELRRLYYQAMASSIRSVAAHMVRIGRFPATTTFLDLGGGDGALALHLARLVPRSRCVVVDRPQTAPLFAERTTGTDAEISFLGCDLPHCADWQSVAATTNVVILSNLLHLLDAERRADLLRNLHNALQPNATVIVYDQFIAETGALDASRFMVVDWLNCGAHFELNARGCAAELETAGFAAIASHRFDSLPGAIITATRA